MIDYYEDNYYYTIVDCIADIYLASKIKFREGINNFNKKHGKVLSTSITWQNTTEDRFQKAKKNINLYIFGLVKTTFLSHSSTSTLSLIHKEKWYKVENKVLLMDLLLSTSAFTVVSLFLLSQENNFIPLCIAISTYTVASIITKFLEKGFEKDKQIIIDEDTIDEDKKKKGKANPEKQIYYKHALSHRFGEYIRYILAQSVALTTIALINTPQIDSRIHFFFMIYSYKTFPIDASVMVDPVTGQFSLAIKHIAHYRVLGLISAGMLTPLLLGIIDNFNNMIVFKNLAGKNQYHSTYITLNTLRGLIISCIKFGVPYLINHDIPKSEQMLFLSFMIGGLAYACAMLFDEAIDITRFYIKHRAEKDREEMIKAVQFKIGNAFLKAGMYGGLGMILYSSLPSYIPGPHHISLHLIGMCIGISIIDGFCKFYLFPKIAKHHRTKEDDHFGFTIGEKVDMAIMTLIIGAAIGFSINAAFIMQNPIDGSYFLNLQSVSFLPGLTPMLFVIICWPFYCHLRSSYNERQDKLQKKVTPNASNYEEHGYKKIFWTFFDILLFTPVMYAGFNIITDSGSVQVFEALFMNWATKQSFMAPMLEFMGWFQGVVHQSFILTCAQAFVMSFILYGGIFIGQRFLELYTPDRTDTLSDDKKQDQRKALNNRPTIFFKCCARFPREIMKYTIRFAIGATVLLAHVLAGLVIGSMKAIEKAISDSEFRDKIKDYYNNQGALAAITFICTTFLAEMVVGIYDQVSYFVLQNIFDLPLREHSAQGMKDIVSLFIYTCFAELPEEFLSQFLNEQTVLLLREFREKSQPSRI